MNESVSFILLLAGSFVVAAANMEIVVMAVVAMVLRVILKGKSKAL